MLRVSFSQRVTVWPGREAGDQGKGGDGREEGEGLGQPRERVRQNKNKILSSIETKTAVQGFI